MSCPVVLAAVLAVLLITVCSLREVSPAARTPCQVYAAARRRGWLRSAAALAWGTLMVVLLVACALLLAVTGYLANAGGIR